MNFWIETFLTNRTQAVIIEGEKLTYVPDMLAIWEGNWKMVFHTVKCNVLSVTPNKNPINFIYTLHDHPIEPLEEANKVQQSDKI